MNEESNHAYYVYGFTQAGLVPEPVVTPPTAAGVCPGAPPHPEAAAERDSATGAVSPPAGIVKSGEPAMGMIPGAGIDEQPAPFGQSFGKVAAIVNLVSRAEFCGPAGEANLQDLAWLAPRARRHQAVIEQVMHLGPVLPARFGTLFSSRAILKTYLREHEDAISGFLERVSGHEEWAVKGFLDSVRAEDELLARSRSGREGLSSVTPGMAYLQEQSWRIKVKQEVDDRLAEVSNGLLEELHSLASAVCERRILSRDTTGEEGDMVLNWAFLVPQPALAEFRGRIERANAEQKLCGLTFELSGPWPPYSFCSVLEREGAPEVDVSGNG
jgi:hypothetical protein